MQKRLRWYLGRIDERDIENNMGFLFVSVLAPKKTS